MSVPENKKIKCRDGEVFTVAGIDFIKFPSKYGQTPAVAKDLLFFDAFGKEDNDLRKSIVLRRMQMEVLPQIIEAVGEDALCTFDTDLTALDGLKPYPAFSSLISLPTFDFYREHADIFGEYKPGRWWWLATPFSAPPNDSGYWVTCVSPSGCLNSYRCINFDICVRPFLIFKSDIFESSGD